ncbi:MAG: YbjN domain-containing protein [Tepidisphaeraceae bacterium]|jgi:hypothetical protein
MTETTSELVTRIMATVRRFVTRREWPFQQYAEGWIGGTIRGDNGIWEWTARCSDDSEFLWFCTYAPVYVPRKRRSAVAEYIALANWGLEFGNLEMGWTEGRVVFRTAIPLAGRRPPGPVLAHQATASFWQMDWHLPGLMAVAHGKISPRLALRRVRRQIEHDQKARQRGQGSSSGEPPDGEAGPAQKLSEPDLVDERRKRWFTSEN